MTITNRWSLGSLPTPPFIVRIVISKPSKPSLELSQTPKQIDRAYQAHIVRWWWRLAYFNLSWKFLAHVYFCYGVADFLGVSLVILPWLEDTFRSKEHAAPCWRKGIWLVQRSSGFVGLGRITHLNVDRIFFDSLPPYDLNGYGFIVTAHF